jgi:DNA-directed RNA polymerase specialized sigma subunit
METQQRKLRDKQALELLSRAKKGDASAKKQLVELCFPMVEASAMELVFTSISIDSTILLYSSEYEDFIQEGAVGLVEAVNEASTKLYGNVFRKAGSFSDYLRHRVKRSLRQALAAKRSILENEIPDHRL